jgi:prenyltransferase beta subunit
MKSLTERLIQSAACSRGFLDRNSRLKLTDFILSHQNPDGGFRGRGSDSDLYYTVFAAASLKALGHPIPAAKVWKYTRSFGLGDGLDLVHLVCLIRLKLSFPMLGSTKRKLFRRLESHADESAYGFFLKLLAEDCLNAADFPDERVQVPLTDPTTNLASVVLVNRQTDKATTQALLGRASEDGGFNPSDQIEVPDLLSTATALFALTSNGVVLDEALQVSCFKYIESLWCESGGFTGHLADEYEDVEYTFYALLAIGCLIQSMAKDYGN